MLGTRTDPDELVHQPLPNLLAEAGCQKLSEQGAPGFSRSSYVSHMFDFRV